MFGINGWEFTVLVAVALFVLGPERLPAYAAQLARLIRRLRAMAAGAGEQMRQELGPEFDDIDWRKLDPRQYDPRRIVRDALSDSFDLDDPLGLKGSFDPAPGEPRPGQGMGPAGRTTVPEFDDDLGWPAEPEVADDDGPGVAHRSAPTRSREAATPDVEVDPDAT